jgi:hypothetical protein
MSEDMFLLQSYNKIVIFFYYCGKNTKKYVFCVSFLMMRKVGAFLTIE